jgi:hypothetical protein
MEDLQTIIDEALSTCKVFIETQYKHADYDETVRLNTLYKRLVTGKDFAPLLPRFIFGEDEILHTQRLALTVEPFKAAYAPCLSKFYNVYRTPVNKSITVKGNGNKDAIEYFEKFFYQNKSVENYFKEFIKAFTINDPNAFLIVDFLPFDPKKKGKPIPYPVIVNSNEVYDFGYSNTGELSYLFCCIEKNVFVTNDKTQEYEKKVAKDYYYFGKGFCIEFLQVLENDARKLPEPNQVFEKRDKVRYNVYIKNKYSPKRTEIQPRIQAFRIGYVKSDDNPRVLVSPIDKSTSLAIDLIRNKSNLDICLLLYNFPTPMIRGERCPGEVHIDPMRTCNGGYISNSSDKCGTCKGYGKILPTSPQHAMYIPNDTDKDGNVIPLDDWMKYLTKPIDGLKMTQEEIERLKNEIMISVFSSDDNRQQGNTSTFIGTNSQPTATSSILKKDNINNTLKPYADHNAEMWKFVVSMFGQFYDSVLECSYEYKTQKFEPLTKEDVAMELSALIDAKADKALIAEKQRELARMTFEADSDSLKRYNAKIVTLPFIGETNMPTVLSSTFVMKKTKVAYLYFEDVWKQLLEETPEIVNKDAKEIMTAFDAKIDEIMTVVEKENEIVLPALNRSTSFNKPQPTK